MERKAAVRRVAALAFSAASGASRPRKGKMRMTVSTAACAAGNDALPRNIFDYEVLDFIGEGAGSLIYVVAHGATGQLHALKHVCRRRDKDQRFIDQLQNEFAVSQRFSHPALRRCIEVRDNHTLFRKATEAALVMELVDGQSLESSRKHELLRLVDAMIQVADGLACLHDLGLVHCDLKPNNILLGANGVKIIDYGQTCRIGSVKQRIQGTPDFMAPEQAQCLPVTQRTDVFNLGATMYWTLTRQPIPTLFTVGKGANSFLVEERIRSPHEIDHEIPAPLSNLVMECIRINPARRPADMRELLGACRRCGMRCCAPRRRWREGLVSGQLSVVRCQWLDPWFVGQWASRSIAPYDCG